jgi:serine/threonine protein phosphatase PrpC
MAPAIIVAEACDRGKEREENQDSVRHAMLPMGELLLVADGVGGYSGGATASRMVVDCFLDYLGSLPADYPADQAIREASAHANSSIGAAANAPGSPYSRMGSTVVLALLNRALSSQDSVGPEPGEIRAWIGHVGDSRAYLMREGRLTRITNDHSAVQSLLNRNLITPEEAQNHPDASVLTRSLGHRSEVEIDIERVTLEVGDSLLLCSDGLWGYVPEREIEHVMASPSLSEPAIASALVDLALAAGGHDNIGLEMARVSLQPVPAEAAPATPEVQPRGGIANVISLTVLVMGAAVLAWAYLTHHLPGFLHLR